ncbi:unnamed protein product, partial [Penicillium nalgiovense]
SAHFSAGFRSLALGHSCYAVWWCVSVSIIVAAIFRVRRGRAVQGFASRPVPTFLTPCVE